MTITLASNKKSDNLNYDQRELDRGMGMEVGSDKRTHSKTYIYSISPIVPPPFLLHSLKKAANNKQSHTHTHTHTHTNAGTYTHTEMGA